MAFYAISTMDEGVPILEGIFRCNNRKLEDLLTVLGRFWGLPTDLVVQDSSADYIFIQVDSEYTLPSQCVKELEVGNHETFFDFNEDPILVNNTLEWTIISYQSGYDIKMIRHLEHEYGSSKAISIKTTKRINSTLANPQEYIVPTIERWVKDVPRGWEYVMKTKENKWRP